MEMQPYYYADNLDDIFKDIQGTKCPMCENFHAESNLVLKNHFKCRHYRHAIFYEIDGRQACILSCRKACDFVRKSENEKKRGHFHCPFCEQIYGRSASFRNHLLKTQGNCGKMSSKAFRSNDVSHNTLFVQEVQKYEELYNSSSEAYLDKDAQELAWSAIASVVNEDEEQCKARWKRLKASYYQYLKFKSDKSRYTPRYYLADHMKFILPFLKKPKVIFQQPTIEIVTDGDPEDITRTPSQEEDNSAHPPATIVTVTSSPDHVAPEIWRKELYDSMEEEEASFEETPYKRMRYDDFEEDPDLSFLKSLLPDIRKMSDRQKSRFKRYTLGVIEDILYGSMANESMPISSLGANFIDNV
ncbi:uncharacterized protein LOC143461882 isoform X2 [Clavelina lepadiformis]|uniref:MADF domain-containing protein n=1 Tax=Clavelina lepadiformis TaxID=159417 RepID=A0ABP0GPJ0_CLALP